MSALSSLPAEINTANARLPATYESAKTALANCASIDECQDWANKAEALASYARMADDDSLRKMADRIQGRAVRRCGELLKQFDGRGGDKSKNGGAPTFAPTRREASERAGLSKDQQVTAVRVSNIPTEKFEDWIESDSPPSVTKLAEAGRKTRLPFTVAPTGFQEATQLLGTVFDFAEFCSENAPECVAGGVLPAEAAEARRHIATIDSWLDRFVVSLKG